MPMSLMERQRELAQIADALENAAAGRGSVTLLDAPSGAGKTALMVEARNLGSRAGVLALEASGSELESDYPFGTVLSLIDSWLATAAPARHDELLVGQARLASPLFAGADPDPVGAKGDDD